MRKFPGRTSYFWVGATSVLTIVSGRRRISTHKRNNNKQNTIITDNEQRGKNKYLGRPRGYFVQMLLFVGDSRGEAACEQRLSPSGS